MGGGGGDFAILDLIFFRQKVGRYVAWLLGAEFATPRKQERSFMEGCFLITAV